MKQVSFFFILTTFLISCSSAKRAKVVSPAEEALAKPKTEREALGEDAAAELLEKPISMSGSYETLIFEEINIDEEEIANQEALGGIVTFDQAFQLALKSIYEDRSDEESPLEVQASVFDFTPPSMTKLEADQISLRGSLQAGGKLCLVPIKEGLDRCFPAERGEAVNENWVFHLQISTISDHLYWIIVPRDGKGAVHNYGFN